MRILICPGASTLIVSTITDDDVEGSHLLPHALLPRQSGTVHGFSREFNEGYVPHVRSYEHDRQHVVARNSISQSLQPDGGLHLLTGPLDVCGGLPVRKRAPIHKFFGIVSTSDPWLPPWTGSPHLSSIAGMSLRNFSSPYSTLSPITTHITSACVVHVTTDYVAPSFVVQCTPHAAKIPNYRTTSEGVPCPLSMHQVKH